MTIHPRAWPLYTYAGRWTVWGSQVSMEELFLFYSYVLYGEEK